MKRALARLKALAELLRRPEEDGRRFLDEHADLRAAAGRATVWDRAIILIKYEGYIKKQRRCIERFRELESRPIPSGTDYGAVPQLRREAVERWTAVRPRNLGQASRVSGIKPTDVTMLMVYLAAQSARGPGGDTSTLAEDENASGKDD